MIVSGDIGHADLISEAAGVIFNPACDRVLSRVEDGVLYGGVTFQGYTGASIHMHTAGFVRNWASREFLWVVFHYAFVQLGCTKVFGQVREANPKALEIDLRLGFKIEAKIDGVFLDGACYVLSMEKANCRWLNYTPRNIHPNSEK